MDTYTCWNYAGAIDNNGYGRVLNELAHRVMWREIKGNLPIGLVLDHLCRNRRCVNPEHLEPVTIGENTRRGLSPNGINSRKTHCIHGHKFTKSNTYTYEYNGVKKRRCKACHVVKTRRHVQEWRNRQKAH